MSAVAAREGLSNPAAEWPFVIELVPIKQLFADESYQRPRQDAFVDRISGQFDSALVGVLDVATRPRGKFAILDGNQRNEIMKKVAKHGAWCAVYPPMTIQEEATFFYRKNKDRRGVHPFYSLRARRTAGDEVAEGIFRIVDKSAFTIGVSYGETNIQAIKAVEDAYSWGSTERAETLTITLRTMKEAFYRRSGSMDAEIIRGVARFWQPFSESEVDKKKLVDAMQAEGPLGYLGRARDKKTSTMRSYTIADIIAREIVADYNRLLGRGKEGKLNAQYIHKPTSGERKIR